MSQVQQELKSAAAPLFTPIRNGHPLHPFCNVCGWRKAGIDSWNGRACKCGHREPPMVIEALDSDLPRLGADAVCAASEWSEEFPPDDITGQVLP